MRGLSRYRDAATAVAALAVTLPALALAVLGYRYRWLADDGDIALRTVRQIIAGHGPVFNVGERVEVNTSVLWTWLLAAVTFVSRLSVYPVVLATSLVLAPAGLLLASAGTRGLYRDNLYRDSGRWFVPAGALVVVALPPFWEFCTSGLETALVFFWLGLSWWLLVRLRPGSSWRLSYLAAFTWGLGWLIRPDMAIVSGCLLAAGYLVLRPTASRTISLAAIALAVPAGYQVFRMGYYAELVPNTAVDKSAGSLVPGRGWAYLVNDVAPYWLWIPALLIAALAAICLRPRQLPRHDQVKIAAMLAAGLLMTGYVIAVGGDFMHARMLLAPTFLLLLPAMVVPLPPRRLVASAGLAVGVGAWALACAGLLRLPDADQIGVTGIVDERSFWIRWTGDGNPVSPAPFLYGPHGLLGAAAARPGPFGRAVGGVLESRVPGLVYQVPGQPIRIAPLSAHAPVAASGVLLGSLGAALPLDALVVDDEGLAYPLASHLLIRGHGRAGHEKTIGPAWVLAQYTPAGYAPPGVSAVRIQAARAALRCGQLAGLHAAVTAPLTWGRFWGNVAHAYSFTRLLVPPDPVTAERQFCGAGVG